VNDRTVLAVDPGLKTGWAMLTDAGVFTAGEEHYELFLDRTERWLTSHHSHGTSVIVVVERFIITGGTMKKARGDENWSIEQIGVLRYLCRKLGHDLEKFAPDARLKIAHWYTPGRGHANDASRHLLLAVGRHWPEDLAARLGI
jgi:hypothetical protein